MSDEEIDSIVQDFEQWGTVYKGGGSEKAWNG